MKSSPRVNHTSGTPSFARDWPVPSTMSVQSGPSPAQCEPSPRLCQQNPQVFCRARKRGRLRDDPGQTPPLLWQLVGTKPLRRHAHNYRYWRPSVHRPYVAWPLVGQIAANVGLTVLEQAGLEMWDQLKALGLVEYGDQLIVKEILAAGSTRNGITGRE
jgi:hypothetical protein